MFVSGVALPVLPDLLALARAVSALKAGVRLYGDERLDRLLAPGSVIGQWANAAIGSSAFPVHAILFDKSPGANWSLSWHQDRTICVVERREVAGFGPWTVKRGMLHVEPPFAIIEAMRTIRVHLDPVGLDNAPLLVTPGSHRLGRIRERDYAEVVARCGTRACLASPGDIWLYATAILHASEASRVAGQRRVLQVDFASTQLPGGLAWRGV